MLGSKDKAFFSFRRKKTVIFENLCPYKSKFQSLVNQAVSLQGRKANH